MGRAEFLEKSFLDAFAHEPTPCQRSFFSSAAAFITSADHDIMVVSGYAGTGKTSAVAAVVSAMNALGTDCILLAPTGRSAKVLSAYAGQEAFTIHKHIYRQKSVGNDGFGQFSLSPNKSKRVLFVVDEVSLLGTDNDSSGGQSSALFGSGNLLEDLVNFVRSGVECKLLMTGDDAQLPPIGLDVSPALSPEYMENHFSGVAFSHLDTVVRQSRESGILHNATMIRKVISDLGNGAGHARLKLDIDGFDDITAVTGNELADTISDAYGFYGEDETIILTRSNKRAIRYNAGIRSQVLFKEERLVKGDRLMVVKNCYQFLDNVKQMSYIANGDILKLVRIGDFEERYGLQFATAKVSFPDYSDVEINAKVVLDTLESESPSLTWEQSNRLYNGVNEDYSWETNKKKRYELVRENPYFNALQLKYSNAVTCHKSQGGQWACVFIDNALSREELNADDLKWLYTALTRATQKVFLVNFNNLEWNVNGA